MPRNRSVSAVLGSSVQRAAPPYSSRSRRPLPRRIVVAVLVLLSLALITISFRASTSGGLHGVESVAVSAMRPFEVAAQRVAQPFRDAYGYVSGLVNAKAEVGRLQKQVDALRQQAVANQSAVQDVVRLKALLNYKDGPQLAHGYTVVTARILSRASDFDQQIIVAAGSDSGVAIGDPVVTQDGLVGHVTYVVGSEAKITLLTDEQSAVTALDVRTQAYGLIRHGAGTGDLLSLDRVGKDQVVHNGDVIVTAGTLSAQYPDLYPPGIRIGTVKSEGQTDTDLFKRIQVQPFVNFGSLDSVAVLLPKQKLPALP